MMIRSRFRTFILLFFTVSMVPMPAHAWSLPSFNIGAMGNVVFSAIQKHIVGLVKNNPIFTIGTITLVAGGLFGVKKAYGIYDKTKQERDKLQTDLSKVTEDLKIEKNKSSFSGNVLLEMQKNLEQRIVLKDEAQKNALEILRARLHSAEVALEKKDEQIQQLEEQLEESVKQSKVLVEDKARVKEQIAQKKEVLQKLQAELQELKRGDQRAADEKQKKITVLEQEKKQLQMKNTENEKQISRMNEQINEKDTLFRKLTEEHEKVSREMIKQKKEIESLQQQLEQLKKEKERLDRKDTLFKQFVDKKKQEAIGKKTIEDIKYPSTDDHLFGKLIKQNEQSNNDMSDDNSSNKNDLEFSTLAGSVRIVGHNEVTIEDQDGLQQWTTINKPTTTFYNYRFDSLLVKPSLKNNGTILFLCVHGTFSNNSAFGADKQSQNTKHLTEFAGKLAIATGKMVKLVSVTWSGALDKMSRNEAAQIVADYVKEQKYDQLWTYAHSHGCNVVSSAAHILAEKEKRCIDVGIHVASPTADTIVDDQGKKEENLEKFDFANGLYGFKRLYHFYGSDDFTQALGSVQSKYNLDRKVRLNTGNIVYNIRLLDDKTNLNHVNIKVFVSQYLAELLCLIDTWYPYHYDLDASVAQGRLPIIAIRHEKIVYPVKYEKSADRKNKIEQTIQLSCRISDSEKQKFKNSFMTGTKQFELGDKGTGYNIVTYYLYENWVAMFVKEALSANNPKNN